MSRCSHPLNRSVHCIFEQYHPSTAPFLAIRFAQRFGISNPSPRFVNVIATAFRTGTYVDPSTKTSFGTGHYGDLAATVAAVLLDREARSTVLDNDPAQGSLQEPFLKLLRVMRSLHFRSDADKPFVEFGVDLQDAIGQEPHSLPNVFSFFLPEFSPAGKYSYMLSHLAVSKDAFTVLLIP